jgi:hypothetical protein
MIELKEPRLNLEDALSDTCKAGLYRYKRLYRYKGIEYLYRYNLKCAE